MKHWNLKYLTNKKHPPKKNCLIFFFRLKFNLSFCYRFFNLCFFYEEGNLKIFFSYNRKFKFYAEFSLKNVFLKYFLKNLKKKYDKAESLLFFNLEIKKEFFFFTASKVKFKKIRWGQRKIKSLILYK